MKQLIKIEKYKERYTVVGLLLLILLIGSSLMAVPKLNEPNRAKEIAKKVIQRDDGKTSYSLNTLYSCSYKKVADQYKCASQPRKKVFEGLSKDVGPKGKDTVALSLLIEPPAESGVAFLQHDFDQDGKDSDQWMYLPALKKLKRIVSESSNAPKTGTLFGSELAYEDVEKMHLGDYHYGYLGEEIEDGKKCLVLEVYPSARRTPKTSYSKSIMWIDKESNIPLKSDLYDKTGKLKKTMFSKSLEEVNGIWVSRVLVVVNHQNKRMSMMKIDKMALNIDIDEGLFQTRAIQDASFRSSQMDVIRKKAK